MQNTKHLSHKTELADRTLWFDGDSTHKAADLLRAMQKYNVKYVDEIDGVVREYNRNVSREDELRVKQEVRPFSFEWNLPEQYQNLNIREYLFEKLIDSCKGIDEDEFSRRALRVITELSLYEKRDLFDVLRAIIYVINTLTDTNSVWGIGRGSSVSSYVLYLIGVHDVDSFAYKLDIEDFLHD